MALSRSSKYAALFCILCFGLASGMLYGFRNDLREERPDQPSPRTRWSSNNAMQRYRWHSWHAQLKRVAMNTTTPTTADLPRLVFVGDSIFELLVGTALGQLVRVKEDVPGLLKSVIGSKWTVPPLVLAASGDQTQHVLWRLTHGELTPQVRADPNVIFILHIGTNNLGRGHTPDQAATGITAVASWLLANTKGKLVLTTLLPRGDGAKNLPAMCPPRCGKDGRPFTSFLPAIKTVRATHDSALMPTEHKLLALTASRALQVNGRIRGLADQFAAGNDSNRVALVECGDIFLPNYTNASSAAAGNRSEVSAVLMPDALHPGREGYRALLTCLRGGLEQLQAGKTVASRISAPR